MTGQLSVTVHNRDKNIPIMWLKRQASCQNIKIDFYLHVATSRYLFETYITALDRRESFH